MRNQNPITLFKEITTIPRDSGDEKAIGKYLMNFAKERGLSAEIDEVCNVIIRKPSTVGYESSPILALQSHTDMVYIKSENSTHNYNSPLVLIEQDGFLRADGSSLGADNGIGMAYALALLDSDTLAHPPLEAIFTAGEETGMHGVNGLTRDAIAARRMINMDSEDEGVFTAGCAGGARASFIRKLQWVTPPQGLHSFQLSIAGLQGGHSGIEIDKGRGNAFRLLGRVMFAATEQLNARVGELSGDGKMNAIPNHASCVIMTENPTALSELVQTCQTEFEFELSASDPKVSVTLERCDSPEKVLENQVVDDILLILLTVPIGVLSMNVHLPDLVESSNNMGVLTCTQDAITIGCALRSSTRSLKSFIQTQLQLLAKAANAELQIDSNYPEWSYSIDSPLRDVAITVFARMYGKPPAVISIHAGLECGFFKELYPDMDMISIGANLVDVHTPLETLDLVSTARVWNWLVQLVAELK